MKVFKIEFYKDEDQEKYIGAVYYYAKNAEEAYKKAKGDYRHLSYDVMEMDEDEVKEWGETIYESKVKTYSEFLIEAIRNLNDDKIDKFIKDNWDNSAITYKYNIEAIMEIAKIFSDVIITKDKKFFHIPSVQSSKQTTALNEIIKKYNLKEV